MDERLIPSSDPPAVRTEPAWWFIVTAHKLMLMEKDTSISIPLIVDPAALGLLPIRERYLGILAGRHCYCAEVAENNPIPPKMGLYGLRNIFPGLDGREGFSAYRSGILFLRICVRLLVKE